jgi:hypothetical protein
LLANQSNNKKKFKFIIGNDSLTVKNFKITIDNGFEQTYKAVAVAKNRSAGAAIVAPVSINNAVVINMCAENCVQKTFLAQENENKINCPDISRR